MVILYVMLFLDMVVVALICGWTLASCRRRLKCADSLASARLNYIRILIDLVYTYSHRPEQLLKMLQTEMSIKKLLCCHVIEDGTESLVPQEIRVAKNDKLLYQLHEEGFTPRELCVIFGLNNLNSVYVKYHRMNKRLHPEAHSPSVETAE